MEANNITLMMATYNRLQLTKRMLDSLLSSTHCKFNLVIIDNASNDGTQDYLNEFCNTHQNNDQVKSIVLNFNDSNKGIAVARNQSLQIANSLNTDWFCTLDNDVSMPENWLNDCINIIRANKKYGMMGVNMEGTPYPLVTLNGYTFQNKPQGNLGTACMVFPKAIHQMLGYFNTEYGIYGEEDADFGMRARIIGYQLGYLEKMGDHFGIGENDMGEYRAFKTAAHKKNLAKFIHNCAAYSKRTKPIYIPYKDN